MHSHVGADSNQQMQFDSYHHLFHRHLFAQSNSNSIISGKCNTMQQQAATSPPLPSVSCWTFPCKAVEELKFGDIAAAAAATTNGWELNHNISYNSSPTFNSVEVENSANGKKTEEEGDDKLNVDGHVESSAEGGAGVVSAAPGLSIPMPFNDDENAPPDHGIFSGCSQAPLPDDAVLAALQKFLPSNVGGCSDDDVDGDIWPALDAYACDEFRMYEFKVRKCVRGRSHDWTECPFAHPGEKARRRDPRRYHYSGTACPDFRKGGCRKGESCEYAHGVFECWLHPARYRTQPCKDGRNCRRRVCFFAHTPEQLRVVPAGFSGGGGESPPHPAAGGGGGSTTRASLLLKAAAAMSGGAYDGSPLRRALAASLDASVALEFILEEGSHSCPAAAANICSRPYLAGCCQASPTSTLIGHQTFCPSPLTPTSSPSPSSSPPLSPTSPQPIWSPSSATGAAVPAHRRHLDRLRSMPSISIPAFYDDTPCYIPSPQVPSVQAQDMMNSPRTMAELISSLQQQLHLKAHNSACDAAANPVMCCSDSRLTPMSLWAMQQQTVYPSRSAPVTPKSRYASSGHQPALMRAVHQPPAAITTNCTIEPSAAGPSPPADMRMESGRHLSAKICTKLTQDHHQSSVAPVPENDTPDFGWVNELVQ